MNKRDNPYTPGAGRKPRTLAGRDRDLESFHSLVERLDAGTYERSLGITPRVNLADTGEQERQVSDSTDAGERPRTDPDVP